jgi:hypothetical protein
MPSCYVDVLIDKEPNHHHIYRHHMNHHAIIYARHCTPARLLRCSSKAPLESTHPVDIAAMVLPSRDVDRQIYPSQTKSLEGGTKAEMRISKEALFKVMSTRFGLRIVENSIENPHFIFCSSFQTLRLGSINFAPTT